LEEEELSELVLGPEEGWECWFMMGKMSRIMATTRTNRRMMLGRSYTDIFTFSSSRSEIRKVKFTSSAG
jgi:hypothetical protein